MRQAFPGWRRAWGAISLAIAGVLLLTGMLRGRAAARDEIKAPAPQTQQERLWAQVGLNDAWYVTHGYTAAPPPADLLAPAVPAERSRVYSTGDSPQITDVPQLILTPSQITFITFADQPTVLSAAVTVSNAGNGALTWTAQLAPGGAFTPTVAPTHGVQGQAFTLTLDPASYSFGTLALTLTRRLTITANPSHTLDSPQVLTVSLFMDPHPPRLALETNEVVFFADSFSSGLFSHTVGVRNTGGYTLAWQAGVVSASLPLFITPTTGLQDGLITITADGRALLSTTTVYTGQVVVISLTPFVLDTPQELHVRLHVMAHDVYLPQVSKQSPTSTLPPPDITPTVPVSEVRAIWVTRYDWTSLYESEGPADIDDIVANVADAGFNTIFFQVRAHGDAYYTPGLEPWSARLNDAGVLGQNPGWDPLARMIEQAHARGVQVHAYVNVYPAWLGEVQPPADTVPTHPFWTWSWDDDYDWASWRHWHQTDGVMSLNDSYLWASPGADIVRDHIVAVVSDIVTRYAVDGVHLDLVRYAGRYYSFDPPSNAAAGSAKTPERDDWQRERVSDLVGRVYLAVRGIRPGARLSAAVWFCYYADGCGYGLSSGYADYYQDSLGWLALGRIDAIAPMLYGPTALESLPAWTAVMLQFQSANAGRQVYPGISGDFDNFGDIAARIQATRDAGAAGHAIFSYGAVNLHGYWDEFAAGPYAEQ